MRGKISGISQVCSNLKPTTAQKCKGVVQRSIYCQLYCSTSHRQVEGLHVCVRCHNITDSR